MTGLWPKTTATSATTMQSEMPNLSFLPAIKQLYEWSCLSIHLSVHHSVCHTFYTMLLSSYHHEIFRSYYQCQKWCPCIKSISFENFRAVTPVLNYRWLPNVAQSLNWHRGGAPLFFQGHPSNFKATQTLKVNDFDLICTFQHCNSSLNSQLAMKWHTKLEVA